MSVTERARPRTLKFVQQNRTKILRSTCLFNLDLLAELFMFTIVNWHFKMLELLTWSSAGLLPQSIYGSINNEEPLRHSEIYNQYIIIFKWKWMAHPLLLHFWLNVEIISAFYHRHPVDSFDRHTTS